MDRGDNMYKIYKNGKQIGCIENPVYILLQENGCFGLTTTEKATGIVFAGQPYHLLGRDEIEGLETVMLVAYDAGKEVFAARNAAQLEVAAKMIVQSTAAEIPDTTAMNMPDLFKTWEEVLAAKKQLEKDEIINDAGQLYRVVQAVTPIESQPPHMEGMLAIYRPIEPEHAGTQEDPIPWVYGMDCYAGTYYSYNGKTYKVAEGGDMIPCTWVPDTPGMWQWVLIE